MHFAICTNVKSTLCVNLKCQKINRLYKIYISTGICHALNGTAQILVKYKKKKKKKKKRKQKLEGFCYKLKRCIKSPEARKVMRDFESDRGKTSFFLFVGLRYIN